jgi:hypothetical protein
VFAPPPYSAASCGPSLQIGTFEGHSHPNCNTWLGFFQLNGVKMPLGSLLPIQVNLGNIIMVTFFTSFTAAIHLLWFIEYQLCLAVHVGTGRLFKPREGGAIGGTRGPFRNEIY